MIGKKWKGNGLSLRSNGTLSPLHDIARMATSHIQVTDFFRLGLLRAVLCRCFFFWLAKCVNPTSWAEFALIRNGNGYGYG
jgi:hypothetical protein